MFVLRVLLLGLLLLEAVETAMIIQCAGCGWAASDRGCGLESVGFGVLLKQFEAEGDWEFGAWCLGDLVGFLLS